jgi:drug/metabolite transporter (DMT)-like permease
MIPLLKVEQTQVEKAEIGNKKSKIDFGLTDLALISMTLIWGFNFIIVKIALSELAPFAFLAFRFSVASIFFLLLVRFRQGGFQIPRAAWGRVALIGIISTTLYQPLYINGLATTKASNTALILATTPAFIVLINRFLHNERLALRGWLGIAFSFGGITLIVFASGDLKLDSAALLGDLFVLGATVLWAMYSVLAVPLLKKYSSLEVAALTTIIGTIPLLVLTAPAVLSQNWSAVSLGSILGVFYSSIFAIVIAYIIWNLGIQRIGGARTAIYSNLTPVIATLLSAFFLNEALTPLKVVGALIIFVGLYFARTANIILEPEA